MWLSDVSAQEGFISGTKINIGYLRECVVTQV